MNECVALHYDVSRMGTLHGPGLERPGRVLASSLCDSRGGCRSSVWPLSVWDAVTACWIRLAWHVSS